MSIFRCWGQNSLRQIFAPSKVEFLKNPPQPCQKHQNKPIKFICQSCVEESLLCQDCIGDHKQHNWLSLESFFNQNVTHLFETGQSKNGRVIEECVQRLINILGEYQQKIQKKLKEFVALVIHDLEKLKVKFPVDGGYNLSSNKLNNQTMGEVLRIVSGQRYSFDTSRLEMTFSEILGASEANIIDNINLAQATLCGHDWELLTQKEVLQIESNYLSVYKKQPLARKFYFSLADHSKGIKFDNNRLTAVYRQEIPKCPLALLDRYMSNDLHSVAFKITKMQTHLKFFNMSVVYIGVCHPSFAERYAYLDIARPSRGAYMISSNGMTYHSKYSQYHQSNVAFSFGKGDIVSIDLNMDNGTVIFQKKTAVLPLLKKVQMTLGLERTFLTQLKPCVMFSSNIGAEVTILNETELRLELDGKIVYPVKQENS